MNTRLQQFLTMEGLTPARFADIMGIQRSGISHLLAGRNKPSFEFLEKILTAYPNLNPEWLILGKGKPYKDSNVTPPTQTAPQTPQNELPDLFQQSAEEPEQANEPPIPQEVTPKITPSQPSENRKFAAPLPPTNQKQDRKIVRITIFYSDGSLEER